MSLKLKSKHIAQQERVHNVIVLVVEQVCDWDFINTPGPSSTHDVNTLNIHKIIQSSCELTYRSSYFYLFAHAFQG